MEWMAKALYNMIAKAKQETFELNGWLLITPQIATELLKFNVRNYRVLNKNNVDKYSKEMSSGLWQKNGEAVVISKSGLLLNGQHRLNAVVKSGKPTFMYVIFDADECTVYDLQSKRSLVQILRDMEFSCSPIVPAISRTILLGKVTTKKIGDAKICEYVVRHYGTLKQAESIAKIKLGCKVLAGNKTSCATIAYCFLRTGEISYNDVIDFFKVLNSGKKCGVKKDVSSAIALRKQILSYAGHGDNLSNRFMEFTYLAMKDFASGTSVAKNFTYPDDGKNAERLIREVQCMDNMCPIAA